MKISIIIPIYNVEQYLERCLKSVVNSVAKSEDIEVLLVNDGSKDNSKQIIDIYAQKYEYMKAYNKENGGLSDARNYGLMRAKGEYVLFIDSDDEIEPKCFKKIFDLIRKKASEVYLWDAIMIDEESHLLESSLNDYYIHKGVPQNEEYTGIDTINYQINDHDDFLTTVWAGAYKKALLMNNNLFFEKGLLHEDELWTIKVLLKASKVTYINEKSYLYRQRNNSIMNQSNKDYSKNLNDIIYIYSSLFSYIDWILINGIEYKKLKNNIVKRYLHSLAKFNLYKYKKIKKKVVYSQIFKNSTRYIDKIKCILIKFTPYTYCKIVKIKNRKR